VADRNRRQTDWASGQAACLRLAAEQRLAPRELGPSTLVRLILVGVRVLALPDIPREIAKHGCEVMVASTAGGGRLPQLAAADDAPESLTLGLHRGRGAAHERGAFIFDQATT